MALVSKLSRDRASLDTLGLVYAQAAFLKSRLPPCVEFDDLVAEGRLALVIAAKRWDPKRQRLKAYARRRIEGAMLDYLRGLDATSRDDRRKFRAQERALARGEEVANPICETKVYQLGFILNRAAHAFDRNAPINHGDTLNEKPELGPEIRCGHLEAQRVLARAMTELSPRNRKVVEMYYFGRATMLQTARHFGINESRVSQVLTLCRRKLKASLEKRGIHSTGDFRLAA